MTGDTHPSGDVRLGVLDLLRLGARLLRPRRRKDAGTIGCRWAREVLEREGGRGLELSVAGRRLRVVTEPDESERILGSRPGGGYRPGHLKVGGMTFLAPHALTIADGDEWEALRAFNEHVLANGARHPRAQPFLDRVRAAFVAAPADAGAIRDAMGRAMAGIVLGGESPADLRAAEDVRVLFDVVQKPLRRKLLGSLYGRRRRRLYARLAQVWDAAAAGEPSLVALAAASAPGLDRAVLLEQVPHWMFTFTGSGSDLLARTLALVTARPEIYRQVMAEIAGAGPIDQAATIDRLHYLLACVLESGRLFPPVTRAFHHHDSPDGRGGEEVVHLFPLLQRHDRLGDSVHWFRPERWLQPRLDAAAAASNLFLRGPRACPGRELILFVCKAALARLLAELRVVVAAPPGSSRLARDPLPISFPKSETRFRVGGVP